MSRPEAIVAGHSNAMALGLPVVARDAETRLVEIAPGRLGLVGAWPRPPEYWNALEQAAPGRDIVVSWQGTEYLSRFLVAPEPLFDFVPRARPESPFLGGVRLVPESAVRALFAKSFADAADVFTRLVPRAARVLVPAPPPPKDDDDLIRRRIALEDGFRRRLEQLGESAETVSFTPPLLRMKLWELTQDLLREAADRSGATYVACPLEARDEHGLLRREYWNDDITHANRAFGALMWRQMEARS
jgi:hypothetical protein